MGDVDNCFHRIGMPYWVSDFFGYPYDVSADELSLTVMESVVWWKGWRGFAGLGGWW